MTAYRRGLFVIAASVAIAACSSESPTASPSSTTSPTPSTSTIVSTTTFATTTTLARTTTTNSTTVPTTTVAPTTSRSPCDLSGFSLAEKRNDAIPQAIALLSTVRAGQHDCYERIVFDFKDENLPEFHVAIASPPFSGPSGIPIPVAGNRFVKVRFGTTYARYPGTGNYEGPDSIMPAGFTAIKEIRLIEDFEAVVVWVIGIDADRMFRVGSLTNPTRVYIDIARP